MLSPGASIESGINFSARRSTVMSFNHRTSMSWKSEWDKVGLRGVNGLQALSVGSSCRRGSALVSCLSLGLSVLRGQVPREEQTGVPQRDGRN